MKSLAASRHFQRQLKKLSRQDQEKVTSALKTLLQGLNTGSISPGLGFKKINGDKYEMRIDIRNRVVMKAEGDLLVCHLIGNHDDVKRYLREYRDR